jgi:predicted enzyme related to lactoylglutathione lyase
VLVIEGLLIDCEDLATMSTFWCHALDFEHVRTGPSGGYLLAAKDGSPLWLGLMPRRDRKTAKNRLHLDLRPDDQDAEVQRLESIGARRTDIGQSGEEPWVVMADPEGNEFCVLPARPVEPW